ncbi:lytic transglycosylase domain-containing protein [Sphingomonas ginkgonis]|uniref:Lytic transglycosylase domain-containing protein n=1 Tax=Sphingomonas ginkgonis TaxID=2315330 RepID=A0A429VC94_9SPHN|nr:transglycosylase SLT domain-containing protein [Sphingomonas ginkgonis]RST31553.1 lytic transglycosylase domain-containing protein [Sphingomonas ginkgonis]
MGPSTEVLRSIAAASRQSGVSFDYLMNQARMESGFNPAAKAPTSTASGLYQFTQQTWLATLEAHGAEHGLGWTADAIAHSPGGGYSVGDPAARQAILDLRNDPDVAASMAAELASDNGAVLSQQLGRAASPADLALAHFLGSAGAVKFLSALDSAPDASAAPLFPEAAAANRNIFYDRSGAPRSLAEIRDRFAAKVGAPVPAFAGAPALASVTTTSRQQFRDEAHGSGATARLAEIEPMPAHLSLSFAQAAYKRLSALGGDA